MSSDSFRAESGGVQMSDVASTPLACLRSGAQRGLPGSSSWASPTHQADTILQADTMPPQKVLGIQGGRDKTP